jgi:hypothetical protein
MATSFEHKSPTTRSTQVNRTSLSARPRHSPTHNPDRQFLTETQYYDNQTPFALHCQHFPDYFTFTFIQIMKYSIPTPKLITFVQSLMGPLSSVIQAS